jgi:hypothetical protein
MEGPGAEIYLSMERGIHRLYFPHAQDCKIRVEIIPPILSKDNFQANIQSTKHRRGEFNMNLRYKGRVEIENQGYKADLFAETEGVLSRLLPDLVKAWIRQSEDKDFVDKIKKYRIISNLKQNEYLLRIVYIGQRKDVYEQFRRLLVDLQKKPPL